MLGVIVPNGMYDVWMLCPSCEEEWPKEVYGVDALEAALDDPVEVCPDCEHAATLHTEREWRQEMAEMIEPKVISPTGRVCTHCGGFVDVDCRCE